MSQLRGQNPVTQRSPLTWSDVGKRVEELRAQRQLELSAVAEQLDCSADELQALERGEPTLDAYELSQLADVLGASLGEMIYRDEAPLFRGTEDASAAMDAATIGRDLMLRFLAAKAVAD